MSLNRAALKSDAKIIIKNSKPSVLTVSLLYLMLSIIVGTLSSRILYGGISDAALLQYYDFVAEGDYDYALSYLSSYMPGTAARIIDFVLTLVSYIVGAGYVLFLLNTIRRNAPCVGNLLDGFGFAFKIIFLNILEGLLIGLWSLLLVVPGVIAAYRYSMALYILVDDPTKSPLQCISESKQLMSGHKMELFILDLSFIGWRIFSSLPVIGYAVRVWSLPYISTVKALYYDRLAGQKYSPYGADYTCWN